MPPFNYRTLAAGALALGLTAAVALIGALGVGNGGPAVDRGAGARRGTAGGEAAALRAIAAQHARVYCGGEPAPGFGAPPAPSYTGRYVNARYGYAVTIPPGLTAHGAAAGPERGFGIVLSRQPRAYLHVDAAYDAFYDIDAAGVHHSDVVDVRLRTTLLSDQTAHYALAGEPGSRYQLRVQCAGDPQVYIHDVVVVVRDREIYRLELQSVPQRYAADAAVLAAMLPTWQWVPVQR